MVYFTSYANEKFFTLELHGVCVERSQVEAVIAEHTSIIAVSEQKLLHVDGEYDEMRNLRVWVRNEGSMLMVITFYPVKKLKAKRGKIHQ